MKLYVLPPYANCKKRGEGGPLRIFTASGDEITGLVSMEIVAATDPSEIHVDGTVKYDKPSSSDLRLTLTGVELQLVKRRPTRTRELKKASR